jgi:hypothetical protein
MIQTYWQLEQSKFNFNSKLLFLITLKQYQRLTTFLKKIMASSIFTYYRAVLVCRLMSKNWVAYPQENFIWMKNIGSNGSNLKFIQQIPFWSDLTTLKVYFLQRKIASISSLKKDIFLKESLSSFLRKSINNNTKNLLDIMCKF